MHGDNWESNGTGNEKFATRQSFQHIVNSRSVKMVSGGKADPEGKGG
jgi:hypothetical protein